MDRNVMAGNSTMCSRKDHRRMGLSLFWRGWWSYLACTCYVGCRFAVSGLEQLPCRQEDLTTQYWNSHGGALRPHTFHAQRVQVPNISRTLVPRTIQGMAFGTRVLKYRVLGPSGMFLTMCLSVVRVKLKAEDIKDLGRGHSRKGCDKLPMPVVNVACC